VLNSNSGLKADKKLGAIDIGRSDDFEAAKFDINTEDVDYNITYLKSQLDKHKGEKAARKAGAIETGRNDEYNAAKFDYNTEDVDYNITYLKKDLDKNKGLKAEKKLGAIEIGHAEGFKQARFEIKNQEIDYNITYLKKDLDKNKGVKVKKKLGALEIGRAEGFQEVHYDLNTEDIDYRISRTKKDLNRNKGQKAEKKLTAIEIGRADNFEAADYQTNVEGIDYNLERTKKDLNRNEGMKVEKKPSHLPISNSYDFTPSRKYDMKKLVTDPIDITYTLAEHLNENLDGEAENREPKVEVNLAVTDVRYDICYLLSNVKKNERLENSTSRLRGNKPKFELDNTAIRRDLITTIKDIRRKERKSILEAHRTSRASYVKSPEMDDILKFRDELDGAQSDNSSVDEKKEEQDVSDEDEVIILKQNINPTLPVVDELEDTDAGSPMSLKPSLLSNVAYDV